MSSPERNTDGVEIANAPAVARAVAQRQRELALVVARLEGAELLAPSLLPEWPRLTVICHLRYGAEANLAVTRAVLAGKPASYYPQGRTTQRPLTLTPRPSEQPADVVQSFVTAMVELDRLWSALAEQDWALVATEPADNVDLGPTTLGLLALLRLTEVEVHGTDLDIGASSWSDVFVDTALPMRIGWLSSRRSNHGSPVSNVFGTWILRPHDGASFAITATTDGVTTFEASRGDGDGAQGDAELVGSKRDLLGFLLGRISLDQLAVSGDLEFAAKFKQAFPSP